MKNHIILCFPLFCLILFATCKQPGHSPDENAQSPEERMTQNELIEKGLYLVTVLDCNICHTPKKMTDQGPVPDMALMLSGHPSQMALPEINPAEITPDKWVLFNQHFTATVGPWGVSFAANLTPHETGMGNWTYEHFKRAIVEGKYKGMENGRSLLPPMPWQSYQHLKEEELKAIFAYLQSIPPIENVVPAAIPLVEIMANTEVN